MFRRRGFTLVELLIVIAVIGVLVAILFPVLGMVAESARRLQCAAHLRQLGVAVAAYEQVHAVYPINFVGVGAATSEGQCTTGLFSWRSYLLPCIEMEHVYDQINFDVTMGARCNVVDNDLWLGDYGWIDKSHPNATASTRVIDLFLCPSDGWPTETRMGAALPANDNYAANFGWPPQATGVTDERGQGITLPYNGLFTILAPALAVPWHPKVAVSSCDVTDGTQNTAMIAERVIARSNFPQSGRPPRDHREIMVHNGDHWNLKARPLAAIVRSCSEHLKSPDYNQGVYTGQAWISGWPMAGAGYMHVMPPNGASCFNYQGHVQGDFYGTASSNHPGGLNLLMADGHVAWIDNSINVEVWWGLGSRNGGEVKGGQVP